MRRASLLSLLLLLVAAAGSAHYAVSPSNIKVNVGGTTFASPYWDHGLVMYEDRDDFVSDDPAVALVSGYVQKVGGSGGITIVGVRTGTAHIINAATREQLALVTVVQGVRLPLIPDPSNDVTLSSGRSIELRVIPSGWTAWNCTWYRGEVGDTSAPLPRNGLTSAFVYAFTAEDTGDFRLWARVTSPDGIADAQFTVRVTPSTARRRSAKH
jgi:hypothetical protein